MVKAREGFRAGIEMIRRGRVGKEERNMGKEGGRGGGE